MCNGKCKGACANKQPKVIQGKLKARAIWRNAALNGDVPVLIDTMSVDEFIHAAPAKEIAVRTHADSRKVKKSELHEFQLYPTE